MTQEHLKLKKGLTPLHLWAIGVGIVISGHYFGWNFGMAGSGYVGMLVAVVITAVMYTTMVLCIAELATLMPYVGGPYAFSRRAMGSLAGFLCGVGVVLEYSVAAPVIALGVGGYIHFLLPNVSGLLAALTLYVGLIILHIIGIREYAIFETIVTVIALGLLLLLYSFGLPRITLTNLFGPHSAPLVPGGIHGIWAALPYAMWLFLAIEMLPMLSEECRDPKKDMPRGLFAGVGTLLLLSVFTVTVTVGLNGIEALSISDNPLPNAVAARFGASYWLARLLAGAGLVGLIASFSGVILAYSRQVFALSRAGYLPSFLSNLHPKRRTPYWALSAPAIMGLILVKFFNASDLILIATFGAIVSYIMMCTSMIILREKEPKAERAYKAPAYPITPIVCLVFCGLCLFSSPFRNIRVFIICLAIFGLAAIYYRFWARERINSSAPEESRD
jgi:ethanolamine permease